MHYLIGNHGAHIYNGNIHQCSKCFKEYKTESGLSKHTCLFCECCRKICSSTQRLKTHLCKSDYSCNLCKSTYQSEHLLQKHKCTFCKKCNINYSTYQKLCSHKCEKHAVISQTSTIETAESLYEFRTRTFSPVNFSWQTLKCRTLNLQLVKQSTIDIRSMQPLRETRPSSTEVIKGDGNCFFRSLSYVITGSESQHFKLRQAVIAHMHTIPIGIVMPRPEPLAKYLSRSRMTQNGQWATQVEIFAAANMLQTNIYLYTRVGEEWKWTEYTQDYIEHTSIAQTSVSIYLNHKNTNHFEPVMSVTATETVNTETSWIEKEIKLQKQMSEAKARFFQQKIEKEKIMIVNKTPSYKFKHNNVSAEKRDREKLRLQNKRKSQEYRETESARKKSSPENRQQEKLHKQIKRASQDYRDKENLRRKSSSETRQEEKLHKRIKRASQDYRDKENLRKKSSTENRLREKLHKQNKRTTQEYIDKENLRKKSSTDNRLREKLHKQVKRTAQEYKDKENLRKKSSTENRLREKLHKQVKRTTQEYKDKENLRKKSSTENRRQEKLHKQNKRTTQEYKDKENMRKKSSTENRKRERCIKQHKRKQDGVLENEILAKKKRRLNPDFKRKEKQWKKNCLEQNIIQNFHRKVKNGPNFVCTCCDQLWYKNNLSSVATLNIKNEALKQSCLSGIKSLDGKEYICSTCKTHISSNRIPPLSKCNGVFFKDQPEELDLTQLEERLVAARIPFMQLRELPRGGQISITGNIVNVPANVNKTTHVLPRRQSDDECIPIKLKRRLGYKHHYLYEYVRPNKVLAAIKWLTKNSTLYQQEGIVVDEEWEQNLQDSLNDSDKDINSGDVKQNVKVDIEMENEESDSKQKTAEEIWDEDPIDGVSAGPLDTLLQSQDILEETRDILSVASAEGSTPVSVFLDKNAESLSFPSLFCGQEMKSPCDYDVKVHYSDLCKSQLRRRDRRVAGHIPDIFFKLKKLQMKHILDKASICLRKTCGKQQKLTAGFLKSTENLNKIIHTDLGFKVFRELRGSPPYWEKVKKDLFALIRYLGIPTWFASFSSADTRWTHLLQILGETVDKKIYTTKEVKDFSWFKKQELVKKDPVTCARHFDFQVRTFISDVLLNTSNPIGEILDYFYKVEFQMRGSPHIHMLLWVKDAPKYEEDEEEEVLHFIDRYVTCEKSEDLLHLIDLQTHSHSRTCKKNNKPICRFNFPIPPMEETLILQPLQTDIGEDEQQHKRNWEKVCKFLQNLKPEHHDLDFNSFLDLLKMNKEDYLKSVRSSLPSARVYLKRSLSETRVNNYNPLLLECWRANMDLQYVLDAYSCAMYIVSYIAKSQRGMSNLLYHAAKEAREGNNDIREQVKFIGNKFLNNVEISAQEAVFSLLQIPLYKSSRDVLFINTSPMENRTLMLKDFHTIENLPDDSEDVFTEGILQQYSKRPPQMEDLCLADYVSKYKRVKQTQSTTAKYKEVQEHHSDTEEQLSNLNLSSTEVYKLSNGYQLMRRQKQVCIRYVRFHPNKDSENHYRESLMLFYPWRCEDELIGLSETYFQQFQTLSHANKNINEKMKEYNHKSNVIDEAVEKLEEIDEEALQEQWNQVAPNTQHVEADCELLNIHLPSTFIDPENDSPEAVELNVGLNLPSSESAEQYVINMISDEDYYQLVRSLNQKQRIFFYYILDKVKNNPENPFHVFLTGGAGVGKTALTTAVYQMLLRYLNKKPGANPDDLKVLLGAPTGKAAFLIGGNTLHHIFQIPASQGYVFKKLSNEKRSSLRCKLRCVSILIIDECSMVGNMMLSFINQRLQEIMGNTKDFGGLSVIAVGDFYQLKPVYDDWIFNNLKEDYGPLARNLWKDLFQVYCLTEIMRQKDDAAYAELLNRLRTGQHNEKDISTLKSRVIGTSYLSKDYPTNTPHIFLTNKKVDAHNDLVYTLSSGTDKILLKASDVVVGDVSDSVKENIMQKIPNNLSKTMGLSKSLNISINSRVEISTNFQVDDGLANGASGQVMGITQTKISKKGPIVWVKFDHEKIGSKYRQSNLNLYSPKIPKSWTPIQEIKRQFPVGRYKNAEVLRTQIPLRPASAKTAHRCQGDTMDAAVVDFEGKARCHCHYVCLSRVKSLNNVFIRTLNEEKICVSSLVQEEMNRLVSENLLKHTLIFPNDISQSNLTVLFHNVRSLHAHFEDIKNDLNFNCSDVNIFVETKLSAQDDSHNFLLPGYDLHRHDCITSQLTRSTYGIAVYSKAHLLEKNIQTQRQIIPNVGVMESVSLYLTRRNIYLVGIYLSPKVSKKAANIFLQQLLNTMREAYIIILGDFNIDLNNTSGSPFHPLQSFQQCILSSTTDYNSILDHIYTNIQDKKVMTGVFESYFSDHKPVWISICDISSL